MIKMGVCVFHSVFFFPIMKGVQTYHAIVNPCVNPHACQSMTDILDDVSGTYTKVSVQDCSLGKVLFGSPNGRIWLLLTLLGKHACI